MSNSDIHGISENFGNNNNSQDDSVPLLYKIKYKGNPKDQSILSFLKQTICPFFNFKSFSFIIIIINIIIFIISLIPHGLNEFEKYKYFLPPSDKTLDTMGDLNGRRIRESPLQAYRWIMGNLLHAYFTHIFFNCFSILVIGTWLEYIIGTWRFIVIYILSGILGSLFSVLVAFNTKSVGASICICGVITAYLGFFIINWKAIPRIFGVQNKCSILFFPILMACMCIPIFTNSEGSGIDNGKVNFYGHLGGMIFGFFLSFIFIKPKDESDTCILPYKVFFYMSIAICCGFAVIGFLCFYLLDKYSSNSNIN